MYRASLSPAHYCLRQGEILSDLIHTRLAIESVGTGEPVVDDFKHPLAILVTQDCDLEQDFAVRQAGEVNYKLIPCLLFCEVVTAEEMIERVADRSKKNWERMQIPLNKNERFHFFQRVEPSCDAQQIGLDELVIDFKRYFAVPTAEVYRRIELGEARRRFVLNSPYLEHLSSRFAYFISRVALPSVHISE
jgi:hypothetical protein